MIPPFFAGDRVDDLYLNVGLPILLLLFIPVLMARVPALRSRASLAGTSVKLQYLYFVGSLLVAASYVAEVVLDPEAKRQDVPAGASPSGMRGFYLGCLWCGALGWLGCAGVAFAESRSGRHSGRSLRLWMMTAMLHASLRFASDVERLASGQTDPADKPTIARLAGFALALLVGLCALCEPDSPSDDAYASGADVLRSFSGWHAAGGGVATAASTSLNSRLLAVEAVDAPQVTRNAEATASYWSRWTFSWLSSILRLGSQRALEQVKPHLPFDHENVLQKYRKHPFLWTDVSCLASAWSVIEHVREHNIPFMTCGLVICR